MRVDYDQVAPTYSARYAHEDYAEVEAAIRRIGVGCQSLLEVGCGTGHWLRRLSQPRRTVLGVDPSAEMLRNGTLEPRPRCVTQGTAEALPFADAKFDFVFAVNALHHFSSVKASCVEAARVLRPGGRFATVGLDPSVGKDRWYIYEYFPRALELDRARYPSRERITRALEAAGFVDVSTTVAQRLPASESARDYLESPAFHRHTTSQLSLLTDAEFEAGIARIWRSIQAAERYGRSAVLSADLTLYVTTGRLPEVRTDAWTEAS